MRPAMTTNFKISDFNPAIQTPLAFLCFVLSTHQYLACDTADSLWKWNEKVAQSCLTLRDPWNSPGQNTGVGRLPLLQGNLPNPGIEPRSPTLQADSLPAEPQGKPKNTGVGSLALLQGIFPNKQSNRGLLYRRRILYQLSYEESQLLLTRFIACLSSCSCGP